jgi:hypothetical protein
VGATRLPDEAFQHARHDVDIPPCLDDEVRSLFFVMDGSNSLAPANFYGEMMDYALALYSAFHPSLPNQVSTSLLSR